MIDTGLRGKVALVTGANHGIGAATAYALAMQGVAVFITYLALPPEVNQDVTDAASADAPYRANRASPGDAVVAAIRGQGNQAAAWEADLSDPMEIPTLFDRVEATLGPVEILVHNAADWEADSLITVDPRMRDGFDRPLTTITPRTHDRHFAVNSRAVALGMAEFARRHVSRGANWGRIINISTDGARCFPGEVSYGASKAALESYTRSAALEFGRYGITANAISPGAIQTGWIPEGLEPTIIAESPLQRLGQPEDIADVAVFLASQQARWITGQVLHVGGGHHV